MFTTRHADLRAFSASSRLAKPAPLYLPGHVPGKGLSQGPEAHPSRGPEARTSQGPGHAPGRPAEAGDTRVALVEGADGAVTAAAAGAGAGAPVAIGIATGATAPVTRMLTVPAVPALLPMALVCGPCCGGYLVLLL